MSSRREGLWIGLATLVALYLAFIEYLPPVRTYHLVGDLDGYHHPLFNYAFSSLKEGRFPLWDPTIYCGSSFPANIQAQLFYPFTWILFLAQWKHQSIRYMALQVFTIAHIWILLQFAYWWLRSGRRFPAAAALTGATVFGFSGYVLNDLQHTGVVCGIAWLPLALWGVDTRRSWMIGLSLGLTFLAGYPATWLACALAVFVYAAAVDPKKLPNVLGSMVLSLAIAGVQLLTTLQLAGLRPREPVYGHGPLLEWHWRRFYPSSLHDAHIYLYYGAGLLLAVPLFLWGLRRDREALWRHYRPAFAVAFIGWLFFQDPWQAVSSWAQHLGSLVDVMQHWNFHIVLSAAAGLFTAAAWAPLAASSRKASIAIFAIVLPALWFEQYWFGMRRDEHFRARGNVDHYFKDDARNGGPSILGVHPSHYQRIKQDATYRIVTDHGPHATELRNYRVTTPLGFDPFLTTNYRREIEQYAPFVTNREFDIPPDNVAMLQGLAVRYYLSAEGRQQYDRLSQSPHFRKLPQADDTYFKVFEFTGALPAYRFSAGDVSVLRWTPEIRAFRVRAQVAGELQLIEQFLPGWRATLDGAPAPILPHSHAFQKIRIPAGEHTIQFEYHSEWLGVGLITSAAGTIVLLVLFMRGF